MMHDYLRFMPIWMAEGLAEYTAHLPYDSGRYNVTGALEGFKRMRQEAGKVKKRGLMMETRVGGKWVGPGLWDLTTSILEPRPIKSLAFDPVTPGAGSTPRRAPSPSMPGQLPGDVGDLHNRYFSAHAMVFYFMHLDGDGKATRIKRFFDAIHDERKLWVDFDEKVATYEAAVAKYQAEWEAFKGQPGVRDLGGGKIQYPSTLTPPTAPPTLVTPGNIDPRKVCAKHLDLLLDGRTPDTLDREVRAAFAAAGSAL
jgi:hypothetical protein